jgi:3-hydroxymyristoyl/3-hydroxydecanoyl-(acyl carrier protein) dehydratase
MAITFTHEDILGILPHRPPFLFVDCVINLIPDKVIHTERTFRDNEPFFAGHFPGKPIVPGVLVTDALAQTCGLLWGLSKKVKDSAPEHEPQLFFLAAANIKFVNPALPGEAIQMTACDGKAFGQLFSYSVEASVGKKTIAKGTLTLAMIKEPA